MKNKKKSFDYPGAKNNSGFLQFFMNRLPRHTVFIEGCAGSAVIAKNVYRGQNVILVEKDKVTAAKLKKAMRPEFEILNMCIFDFISSNPMLMARPDVVLYLDPPYPFLSRRSTKKLYRCETTPAFQLKLLTTIKNLACKIMISTRQNDLYSEYLADWVLHSFKTSDHGGSAVELLYTNFDTSMIELFNYDYLGENFTERQFLARQVKRIVAKLEQIKKANYHQFYRIMNSLNELK